MRTILTSAITYQRDLCRYCAPFECTTHDQIRLTCTSWCRPIPKLELGQLVKSVFLKVVAILAGCKPTGDELFRSLVLFEFRLYGRRPKLLIKKIIILLRIEGKLIGKLTMNYF